MKKKRKKKKPEPSFIDLPFPSMILDIECPLERKLLLEALNAKIWDILSMVDELDEYSDELNYLPYLRSLRNRLEVI